MSYGKVNKTTGERIPYAGNSGGGTSDYTDLTNKPSINSVTLSGNKTASDLSLASTTDLADKQDKFERISYANWQQLTPQQQAAKPYYIYDYPSSAITARNVVYNNTSSGMSADDVQEAVDELKSGLTNLLKFVDITVTDTISLTANTVKYLAYPQTGITDGSTIIGVRLLSATGGILDGNVGAYLGAYDFIHLISVVNKSFTSITFRIYYYGGS